MSAGGGDRPPTDAAVIFAGMLQRLETDPLWAGAYDDFVRQVSFAAAAENIKYTVALDAVRRLIAAIGIA
jgi:hypothetical protein